MTETSATATPPRSRRGMLLLAAVVVLALGAGGWLWRSKAAATEPRKTGPAPIPVITAAAVQRTLPVRLNATGTVTPLQSVDVRAQVTSTVAVVHVKEGQAVQRGDLLFTLDARSDDANLRKADAQVAKSRSDLANARRNLDRQRELFEQKFISQAALDVAQNQYDVLRGQLAVDEASVDASRVSKGYTELRAPFAGRTGSINVYPGSLVQPGATPLVTITQIDPINVSFTLAQRELPGLQAALAGGKVPVTAQAGDDVAGALTGTLSFLDNAVDTTSGTIRLKAQFANAASKLWPGMFVNVSVAPRVLVDATVVPVQAVQTGPERRFVYQVDADSKVASRVVEVLHIQDGFAAVSGIKPGDRVVVEGAQNLRPGTVVAEARKDNAPPGAKPGKSKAAAS